jgi:hypothetical protein
VWFPTKDCSILQDILSEPKVRFEIVCDKFTSWPLAVTHCQRPTHYFPKFHAFFQLSQVCIHCRLQVQC